jgi:hypothetical protein
MNYESVVMGTQEQAIPIAAMAEAPGSLPGRETRPKNHVFVSDPASRLHGTMPMVQR